MTLRLARWNLRGVDRIGQTDGGGGGEAEPDHALMLAKNVGLHDAS